MHVSEGEKNDLDKALIEENGYSGEYAPAFTNKLHPCSVLVKINNAVYKPFKLALGSLSEK